MDNTLATLWRNGENMKRTTARELAFKTIYSKFFNAEENDDLDSADSDGLEFTSKILKSFAENYDEINKIIYVRAIFNNFS